MSNKALLDPLSGLLLRSLQQQPPLAYLLHTAYLEHCTQTICLSIASVVEAPRIVSGT